MNIPYKFRETPSLKNGKRKAFALVLALALMGFIVLLVVSLSTMVQMQMRLSRQSLNDFKAKQAAKYAAYEAMSQIQSALGPDQRVSANAMIFDDRVIEDITDLEKDATYDWWTSPMKLNREDVKQINDAALSQNRYWVGVWNSAIGHTPEKIKLEQDRNDYVQKTIKQAVTWLVSGNGLRAETDKEGASIKYKPNSMLEAGKYVRAVSAGSYTDYSGTADSSIDVLAPLVTLEKDPDVVSGEVRSDGKETRIAWWVADEGQKASLNAVASKKYLEHAERIKFRKQSMPFYSGIHGLTLSNGSSSGNLAFDLEFDDDDDTSSMNKIRNLDSVKQLDVIKSSNIPETIRLSKVFFHDVSFNTRGLLVNVREGGLKKDLSLGLTRKDFANENPTDKGRTKLPEYFERPYGIGGYDYKTSAYPLIPSNFYKQRRARTELNLKGKGHMFGPQMYGNEDIKNGTGYVTASSIAILSDLFDDRYLWKDTGGPLWDQLRSYYNMRTDDNNSALIQCVQTDDRIALKPVVKRFQVFFIPSFTKYEDQLFGLRLNIVPMLVLWNPYDTKIGGNGQPTYYAIRVQSHSKHCIGAFRFAIGYESGGRFQCLRDLLTEYMPFYGFDPIDVSMKISDRSDYLRRYGFRLSKYGIWNGQLDINFSNASITNPTSKVVHLMMSKKTAFYGTTSDAEGTGRLTNIGDAFQMYYPLGYGALAPSEFTPVAGGSISISNNNDEPLKAIVTESNLVPDFKTAYANSHTNANMARWTARVAKIPLYLNNLLATVGHGTSTNMNRSNFLFYGQREIDSYDPSNYAEKYSNYGGANLHFLAKDEEGLEPGATKLFVMEEIVNYIGDPNTRSNNYITKGNDGPNGAIEFKGRSASPYENKGALMKPYAGKMGCFFIDVPHAETENQYKYDSTQFRPWWGNAKDSGGNLIFRGRLADKKYRYVLFDLNKVADLNNANNQLKDTQNQNPPTDIKQYMVDMEDIVGVNTGHEEGTAHTAFYASMNMTPIGYGLVTYYPTYLSSQGWTNNTDSVQGFFAQHRQSGVYWDLQLHVWMWQREDFKFSSMTNNASITGAQGGSGTDYYPQNAPLICFMQGYRFVMGEWQHSFPDPTVSMNSGSTYVNGSTTTVYNGIYGSGAPGHGMVRVANSGSKMYLAAITYYSGYSSENEGYYNVGRESYDGPGRTPTDEFKNFGKENDVFDKDGKIKDNAIVTDSTEGNSFNFRMRYYLNWLGINSRRHSSNSWILYGKKTNYQYGDLLDGAPAAIYPLVIDANNNNYQSDLNKDLSNNSTQDNKVPYGIVFAQNYPKAEVGSEGFFNRKMFLNGNPLATGWQYDFNAKDMTNGSDLSDFANSFGRLQKSAQALTQVWGSNGDGITKLAYKINHNGGKVRIGVSEETGNAYNAPVYHILRETEVVSNPANLAGAQLTFGVGQWALTWWSNPPSLTGGYKDNFERSYGVGYPDQLNVSFPIGNSLCPSRISPDRSFQIMWIDYSSKIFYSAGSNYSSGRRDGKRDTTWYEDKNTLYDMSWHLNNILWDEYFFSTLPYRNNEFNDPVDSEVATPQNPRIQYCKISPKAMGEETDLQLQHSSFRSDTEDQYVQNAARFWVNGAFNVNSTNVDAWKAVLSTYFGTEVQAYDGSQASSRESAGFHRYSAPYSASTPVTSDTSIDDDGTYMKSFRTLSQDEIEELALSIVEHVKDRGPFYSMSHFVNRVVSNPSAEERYTDSLKDSLLPIFKAEEDRKNLSKEYSDSANNYKIRHMQKGVLQDAIDRTSINRAFHMDNDYLITVDNQRNVSNLFSQDSRMNKLKDPRDIWENWRGAVGPQVAGVPGYLMQQDVLSRLGSFLTVRSDTFKIRAYGEVRNPISGIVEGKAWCEMVVQRVPEYIDQTEASQEAWRIDGREPEIGSQNGSNITIGSNKLNLDEISTELSTDEVNKQLGRRFKIVSFKWLNEKEI